MIRETIEIEVSNIDVDTRYYSFDYKIKRNGKIVKDSSYSDDHSWDNDFENFKKLLEKSFAVELALEQLP